ncbi:MAG: glutathione S-transferase family protein [Deltaproteobacteria bacterium]|nr:MAG: glutathione S-transferase family protein [Deltaproteobacteria bacterium]
MENGEARTLLALPTFYLLAHQRTRAWRTHWVHRAAGGTAGGMLTLYDDVFSPYARKVRIALYEKGVAFERVRALHGDCNRTDFLHVNPRAEVPALVDGDIHLYDSTVICEYLEDRYPAPPIYPREPGARAQCRLLEDLADTQLDAALYAVVIVEMGRGEAHPAIREATGRDLLRLYDELERRAREPFFCGDFSVADMALAPHLMAAMFLGFPLDPSRHPKLTVWIDRVQARPSVARDNADVMETLQRLQAAGQPGFDPYRVQWRSDRLEWVMKNGLADWFMEEMRAGRVFFPLSLG